MLTKRKAADSTQITTVSFQSSQNQSYSVRTGADQEAALHRLLTIEKTNNVQPASLHC